MTSFYPGGDPPSAFADALARARQIAAKIGTSAPESNPDSSPQANKRPFEGGADSQPEPKKMASSDPLTNQLRSLADQQNNRPSPAIAAAAAAASQINQKLGAIASQPSQPPLGMGMPPHSGMGGGAAITEDFEVPDRMVGLIIGKGGEQIASIQAESCCKVQFAPDSNGMANRPCTLTGSREAIDMAIDLMSRIIARGQGAPDPCQGGGGGGAQTMVEMLIPGNKVGLVIGKGGESIRQLQERAGVKMVMIQDNNVPSHMDKPLRITGDPMKCQRAKEMVQDLIAEKDMEAMGFGGNDFDGGPGGQGGGGGPRNSMDIRVPRTAVGVVIGKNGDMIKKIQVDTGARVQFMPDDGSSQERICTITGNGDKVNQAAQMIHELVSGAMNRQGGPMGRGRGRGRGDGGPPGAGPGGMGRGRGFGGNDQFGGDATNFNVPADKCGLVIGKGGETIREINRQSNAHVELHRGPGPSPNEKVFTIRGNPGEIDHAISMICEKAGLPHQSGGGAGGMPGQNGSGPGHGGPAGPMGGYDQYGQQQYGGQQGNQQPPQQQYNAPQGWGSQQQNYGQWQNQSAPAEQNKSDPNAAAWAAYYAQYYGQQQNQAPGQPGQQPPGAQPPAQPAAPPQQQQQPPAQAQAQPQAAVNPATGQMDYSQAWADYYRQQGLHYHAQAIIQQASQPAPQ